MKHYLSILFSFILISYAEAIEVRVNGTIQHEINTSWSKVSKYRHSLDCYPMGKGTENNALGSELIQATQNLAESNSQGIDSKFDINLGSVNYNIQNIESTYRSEINLTLNSKINWSAYRNKDDSKCVLREYHWKVSSHKLSGKYDIKFKIPKNVWFVSLKLENSGQMGNFGKKVVGDLHSTTINPTETILWVRPESEITIPLELSGYVTNSDIGKVSIIFQKGLASSVTYNSEYSKNLRLAQKNLVSFNNNQGDKSEKISNLRNFLNLGQKILESSTISDQITRELNLDQNKAILDWLFQVANDPTTRYGLYTEHIKAMSAAIGYQLSLSLLKDLMVFCKDIDVYLPLTDKTIRTSGLKAAFFWMNKDLKRLENIRFPEIRALVEEIVRWENLGLKYSEVAYNKVEFKKLDESYLKIRKYSEIGYDVFGDLKFGLNKTLSVFGSAGTNLLITNEIKDRLDSLALQRRELNKSITKLVMSFTYDNQSNISASSLLAGLNALEKNTLELSRDFKDRIKLVSVGDENESATAIMTSLLAHQLAIFEKPLQSSFAEPIRLLFYQLEQDQNISSTFNKCLGE